MLKMIFQKEQKDHLVTARTDHQPYRKSVFNVVSDSCLSTKLIKIVTAALPECMEVFPTVQSVCTGHGSLPHRSESNRKCGIVPESGCDANRPR